MKKRQKTNHDIYSTFEFVSKNGRGSAHIAIFV